MACDVDLQKYFGVASTNSVHESKQFADIGLLQDCSLHGICGTV